MFVDCGARFFKQRRHAVDSEPNSFIFQQNINRNFFIFGFENDKFRIAFCQLIISHISFILMPCGAVVVYIVLRLQR
jgi:hypothetical protein